MSMQGVCGQAARIPKGALQKSIQAWLLKFLFSLKVALMFTSICFGNCPTQNDFPLDLSSSK